jgi:hypothetical protein
MTYSSLAPLFDLLINNEPPLAELTIDLFEPGF